MTTELQKNLEKSIIEKLPQIPYVLDQVGDALEWAREVLDEGVYVHLLKTTLEATEYVRKISDPHFFKVHYVVALILAAIPDVLSSEKFNKFKSTSNSIEDTILLLNVSPKLIEDKGCFKAVMLHLIPLAKSNPEIFTICLIGIKNDLIEIIEGAKRASIKTPIMSSDYITIMGYALVMANIRMANLTMSQHAHKVYNDILVLLNNDVNY